MSNEPTADRDAQTDDPTRETLVETDVSESVAESERETRPDDPIVRARDISVWYNDDRALRDVTIDIPENKVTAIIGPSGCGKSTFLRCINRMNDLVDAARVEGELYLGEKNVYDDDVDPVALRRRVGMVFQAPNPFPKSIYDNVAYGLRIQDRTDGLDGRVEDALKRAALWDEVGDRLDDSALDPEVILMDEPASALDPVATSQIEDLIEELAQEYTVVIVTHNMQQAARISDKTAVFLTGGELVEYDDTETIFENPEHQRVEDYI
ncbi:MAG: phosphate ABC transporter ATP-binding protein, partial [Halobacteriaceae archaeon]